MHHSRKAVSAARAQNDPPVGFTAGELNAEMRAILDEAAPQRIQDGDLTVPRAMAYWGLKEAQTYQRLTQLVEQGRLSKAQVLVNGKIRVVWRPAKRAKKSGR